jgi:hypothetical protein
VQEKQQKSNKKLALFKESAMYRKNKNHQIAFTPGLQMNQENCWVKKAAMISWDKIEYNPI